MGRCSTGTGFMKTKQNYILGAQASGCLPRYNRTEAFAVT